MDKNNIVPEMVLQVYSGKQGCMCGCIGKYSVNPARKEEADKERGYEDDVGGGMREVKRVLRILQADSRAVVEGHILYVPDQLLRNKERRYAIYLSKNEGSSK